MDDEYIGSILYNISRPARQGAIAYCRLEMYEKFVNEASEHGMPHVAPQTSTLTAMGLQLSEIENCVAQIVISARVCIKQCCKT